MSDEQPSFKVTDRRLFKADGTLREDLPPEEEAPVAAKTEPAAAEAAAAPAPEQPAPPAAEPQPETNPEELDGAPLPGEEDPASFINFVMSIASNAAAALGMMEHPVTGQRSADLQLAHHWLDILGMLQEKTKGNLHAQEQQALDGILADLRMQFVALTRAAAQKARSGGAGGAGGGFTAQDILGGK